MHQPIEVVSAVREALSANTSALINDVEVGGNGRPPLMTCPLLIMKSVDLPLRIVGNGGISLRISEINEPHRLRRRVSRGNEQQVDAWSAIAGSEDHERRATFEEQVIVIFADMRSDLRSRSPHRQAFPLIQRFGRARGPGPDTPELSENEQKQPKGRDSQSYDIRNPRFRTNPSFGYCF